MKKLLLVLLLLVSSTSVARMYKWTDAQGRVHFSDSPSAQHQSEAVDLKPLNSYAHVTYEKVEFFKGYDPSYVVLYGASWCKYCKKARAYFRQNRIAFTEFDIEKNSRARKEFDELGGRGVPLIIVGHYKMNGFNVSTFRSLYHP